jgi:hypothetical protein
VIPGFGEPARGWLLLAMASTLAGNLTLLVGWLFLASVRV